MVAAKVAVVAANVVAGGRGEDKIGAKEWEPGLKSVFAHFFGGVESTCDTT